MEQQSKNRAATNPAINARNQKKYYKKRNAQRAQYKSTFSRAPRVDYARQELVLPVPECTKDYLKALCNPWDTDAGVCLPADVFPLPSQKVKVYSRGTFQLGTGGYGYISLGPAACSDTSGIAFTTSTSVMTSSTLISAVTAVGNANFSKIPFTTADVVTNNLAQCRVVAAGIRIRYAGTEDLRQGNIVAFEEQDHSSIMGYSYLTLLQQTNVSQGRPRGDGQWDSCVTWSGPVQPRELEFLNDAYPYGVTGASYPVLVMVVQGAAGASYDFDICQHLEYIGSKTSGKTKSHADPNTYAKALNAAKEVAAVKPLSPDAEPTLFDRFINGVKESLPKLMAVGQMALGGIARNPGLLASGASQLMIASSPSNQSTASFGPRLTRTQRAIMA